MVSESARTSGWGWGGGMVVVVVVMSGIGAVAHACKDREAQEATVKHGVEEKAT